jgi:excinuclease UvrABC nuclease subunit
VGGRGGIVARLTKKRRPTGANLDNIPNRSGVYVLHRGDASRYVGSAGARRLQDRIRQQLTQKRGITSIQYAATSGEEEARRLEKRYRDRLNPKQRRV